MASSTPSHCPISAPKPYQNLHNPQTNAPHRRQNNQKWSSRKFTLGTQSSTTRNPANSGTTTPISDTNPNFPPFPSFSPSKSELGHEFRGRRSTRFVSKMHFGRPKTLSNSRHTSAAEEALQQILHCNRDRKSVDYVLRSYELRLCSPDDYTFLLRELGNRGECSMAMQCFEFAIRREERRIEQGKLASAVISVLGRLGRVDLAKRVFETAYSEGYGNTVYAFSALISAYGRSGRSKEAIEVFESMKDSGLKPNLVTYNAVIDACGKGGMEFNRVTEMFDEMVSNGVQPDRITFNSLIAVCSREGWWEAAQNMFNQMVCRGIERDMYTYNTLLDAICKGGRLDLAFDVMSEMTEKNMSPNVVTYSTMIDGLAKAGKLDEALNLFNDMKLMGIGLDRVMYNTLLGIYARLGRLEEALEVCDEMDKAEIKKDIVSYNALLGGYGKQGKFDKVNEVFEKLRVEHVHPNVLTYSTLIDVYLKGGLYREALETFREFQQIGLKADVVLYSGLIDALCKIGQVESAVSLLDGMAKIGIQPNIVTYNSIIDAFGQPETLQFQKDALDTTIERQTESSTYIGFESAIERSETNLGDKGIDKRILMILEKLAVENMCPSKEDAARKSQILCILEVFQKMHQLQIKPNVVTFSAILNACSRCNSFGDASMLLEELRLFDNQVYGVAHGLLMGCRGKIWVEAQSLFDEVKCMDSATSSAFYNALTDLLWHFGQRRGAQLVVLEGKRRHVWENVWCDACLDLHLMSSGAAQAMVHAWLLDIRSVVFEGRELPRIVSILTGWGKHSKVAGDGTLRRSIEALLTGIGAPFHVTNCNLGRFISKGSVVAAWLRESGTLKVLILHDERTNPESEALKQPSNLQVLPL